MNDTMAFVRPVQHEEADADIEVQEKTIDNANATIEQSIAIYDESDNLVQPQNDFRTVSVKPTAMVSIDQNFENETDVEGKHTFKVQTGRRPSSRDTIDNFKSTNEKRNGSNV